MIHLKAYAYVYNNFLNTNKGEQQVCDMIVLSVLKVRSFLHLFT